MVPFLFFPVAHRLWPFRSAAWSLLLVAPPTTGGGVPLRQNSGSKGAPSAAGEPMAARVHFAAGLAERPLLRHRGGTDGEDEWSPASCCDDKTRRDQTRRRRRRRVLRVNVCNVLKNGSGMLRYSELKRCVRDNWCMINLVKTKNKDFLVEHYPIYYKKGSASLAQCLSKH